MINALIITDTKMALVPSEERKSLVQAALFACGLNIPCFLSDGHICAHVIPWLSLGTIWTSLSLFSSAVSPLLPYHHHFGREKKCSVSRNHIVTGKIQMALVFYSVFSTPGSSNISPLEWITCCDASVCGWAIWSPRIPLLCSLWDVKKMGALISSKEKL